MDLDLLNKHIADGTVTKRAHPTLPLHILNYSPRCQYDKLWDDVTLQCRGLVMHGDKVVARPFRKFFNDTEHKEGEIPWHLPCEITEKLDGSLLIAFYFDGAWRFCTRGAFESPQAIEGERIFREKYDTDMLCAGWSYLFEVLYAQNRIVVDYGDRRDTVLLAAISTATGAEFPLNFVCDNISKVRTLPPAPAVSVRELRSIIRDDEEGYVIRFSNGFRVKVKGQRYMELHRLLSGLSSRTIWENLSAGRTLDDILAVIPDEYGDWVRRERDRLANEALEVSLRVFKAVGDVVYLPDRKSQAIKLLADYRDVASAVFLKLDGKDCSAEIWKKVYPELRKPEFCGMM